MIVNVFGCEGARVTAYCVPPVAQIVLRALRGADLLRVQ
jgi:hypothetical protein